MITDILPCDKDKALALLDDAIEWLRARVKLTLIVGFFGIGISALFALIAPFELTRIMGLASILLLLLVTIWLYRGNTRLLEQVMRFRNALASGEIEIGDYCDIALVTAVVAYDLKRAGRVEAGIRGSRR